MEETKQTITDQVMMIRPANFGYNPETAVNNAFQKNPKGQLKEISQKAIEEFDQLVSKLRENGVTVQVFEDTHKPVKPDALFPNNWISFHQSGTLITYPMFAPSRRKERREDIIEKINQKYKITRRYSFEMYEAQDEFLEGTGSMVLDRANKICYACLSQRTEIVLLNKFGLIMGYKVIRFNAADQNNVDVYHTNVIMALGEDFVVIASDMIPDLSERHMVIQSIRQSGKQVIEISENQVAHFAGNMLQVKNKDDERLVVMSTQAYNSLKPDQLKALTQSSRIIHSPLDTIERYGGGSARCMIAEIFLPKKEATQ